MNTDTNELYDLKDLEALREETDDRMMTRLEDLRGSHDGDDGVLQRVPASLHGPASRILKGKPIAKVARHSGGKLSRWAASKRRNR